MAKYPRIGKKVPVDRPQECACCEVPATKLIHWQFDYMRGNDEIYAACGRHLTMATRDTDTYWCNFREKNGAGGRITPLPKDFPLK